MCINCHQQVQRDNPKLAPLRESWSTGKPVEWVQIHKTSDFVFFNHAVHVQNGVNCQACHGPVESMQEVYQAAPLTMEWCVQCHRAPERYITPRATRASGWMRGDLARGRAIAARYDVQRLLSCTTCHR